MSGIFLTVVNMSIAAGYFILAVLLLRPLLRKAPKWITVLLWGIVGVRLVCPYTMESVFSLIPGAKTITMAEGAVRPQVNLGISAVDGIVNDYLKGNYYEGVTRPTGYFFDIMTVFAIVWAIGVAVLLGYMLVSYVKTKRSLETAVLYADHIYQSERVSSPFVLGFIFPKIYLPFGMNDRDMAQVIAHEKAHIRRKDYLWKPLGFLILCLHWFNPLVWLGYLFLCRDIELACDESAIKTLSKDDRADYSMTLLHFSVNAPALATCPFAFGEVGVKKRIKTILSYQKPRLWMVAVAVVVCVAVCVCFLTSPAVGIFAQKIDSDTVMMKIPYSDPSGSYSVRMVAEEEGEYKPDGMGQYDGSLGKYRILVRFGDSEPTDAFHKEYYMNVVEIENAPIPIRVKMVSPSDCGFYLYIGFDEPISVDEVENKELSFIGGYISIPIEIGK